MPIDVEAGSAEGTGRDKSEGLEKRSPLTEGQRLAVRDYMRTLIALPAIVLAVLGALAGYVFQELRESARVGARMEVYEQYRERLDEQSRRLTDLADSLKGRVDGLTNNIQEETLRLRVFLNRAEQVDEQLVRLETNATRISTQVQATLARPDQQIVPQVVQHLQDPKNGFI